MKYLLLTVVVTLAIVLTACLDEVPFRENQPRIQYVQHQ